MEDFIKQLIEYLPTILSAAITGVCGLIFSKLKAKVEQLTQAAQDNAKAKIDDTNQTVNTLVNENKALRNDIKLLTETISRVEVKRDDK